MTRRKASIARAKRAAYIREGTCELCGSSIVWDESGVCRACRPGAAGRKAADLAAKQEYEAGVEHFRYFLASHNRDGGEFQELARSGPVLQRFFGALRQHAIYSFFRFEVRGAAFRRLWEASQADRRLSKVKT